MVPVFLATSPPNKKKVPRPNFRTLPYNQEIIKAYSENIDKTLARTVNPNWGKLRDTVQSISRDDNTTITMIEFQASLKKLRNNKCVGCDQVPIKALRCLSNSSLSIVHQTVKNAYETGELNVDFLTSLIIALPKKKGTLKSGEHRTIAIFTHTEKFY